MSLTWENVISGLSHFSHYISFAPCPVCANECTCNIDTWIIESIGRVQINVSVEELRYISDEKKWMIIDAYNQTRLLPKHHIKLDDIVEEKLRLKPPSYQSLGFQNMML